MRIIKISKRNGSFRTIYAPGKEEKTVLKQMVGKLEQKASKFAPESVVHGFSRGKSPVTNAQAHIGHVYTLCFDLQDFFESVTEKQLVGKLSKEELAKVLVDSAARQGLPTSPAVANIAAADMDKAILKLRDKKKLQFIYTRYADDMTFSFDDIEIANELKKQIPIIVSRCGFKINKDKTKFQSAKFGRRHVTGIAVGNDGIYPTREAKRRLRAAQHQAKRDPENYFNKARGLAEWCQLKEPRDKDVVARKIKGQEEADILCDLWKLPKLKFHKLPDKGEDEILENNCLITGDIPYTLGASTFTSGWTSCLRQSGGQYRRTTLLFCYLRGTKIAMLQSDNSKVFGGVERKNMKARCWVHTLRNGVRIYDRFYGDVDSIATLVKELEDAGIISAYEAKKLYSGEKVVGHSPYHSGYFDNLSAVKSTASTGAWKGKKVTSLKLK